MARSHHLILPALITSVLISACGPPSSNTAAASPHPSPQPYVSSASLLAYSSRGTDLSAGWTATPSTNGTDLTVDNGGHPCHQPYPSDTLRQAKNGVTILNASDPSQVADDIVYYRDHGAEQALNEISDLLNTCTSYQQVNNEALRSRSTSTNRPQVPAHSGTTGSPSTGASRWAAIRFTRSSFPFGWPGM